MQDLWVVQVYIHVAVIFINTVIVGNFNGFKKFCILIKIKVSIV